MTQVTKSSYGVFCNCFFMRNPNIGNSPVVTFIMVFEKYNFRKKVNVPKF